MNFDFSLVGVEHEKNSSDVRETKITVENIFFREYFNIKIIEKSISAILLNLEFIFEKYLLVDIL
ncbi:MAG: hypothetical protein KDC52_18050, partial [Ignavibacteriae bacterium]|nr:hypothetical protein [Ignavibacteriota bacterium]MCB9248849.1 hypothetical protein [Ignavibacteriales bacterium]